MVLNVKRSRRKKVETDGANLADTNQILQLSLFMMLLAFFMVLNATSQFEDGKVKPVVESLYKTFGSKLVSQDTKPSEKPDPIQYLNSGQALEYFSEVFNAELPQVTQSKQNEKGVMQLVMPRDMFESLITSTDQTTFDRVIAAMLFFDQRDNRYVLDVIVPYSEDRLSRFGAESLQVPLQRLERYVQILIDRGLSKDMMSLSMNSKVNARDVVLVFRPAFEIVPDKSLVENIPLNSSQGGGR
tara:strand:- start:754 stop:1482 length:729 start_codon:yes stop_codon:yes gene_type:complete